MTGRAEQAKWAEELAWAAWAEQAGCSFLVCSFGWNLCCGEAWGHSCCGRRLAKEVLVTALIKTKYVFNSKTLNFCTFNPIAFNIKSRAGHFRYKQC
jgi:hypothetical protein